jgi:hypothetical protein
VPDRHHRGYLEKGSRGSDIDTKESCIAMALGGSFKLLVKENACLCSHVLDKYRSPIPPTQLDLPSYTSFPLLNLNSSSPSSPNKRFPQFSGAPPP